MNDHELDALLTQAAIVTDNDIAEWTRDAPFNELCEEIMSNITEQTERPHTPALIVVEDETARRRRPRLVAAAAAAAIIVVAIGAVINVGGSDDGRTAWAAELVEFAQRSPLMLIDDPAWQVTYADENGNEGELRFTNGQREAELAWQSGPLSELLDDRLDTGTDHDTHGVVNGTATIVQYDGSDEYTALWNADGLVLEFRTQASNVDEFAGLLDALAVVDVDSWLTALPSSVIEAADQSAVVSDILAGIPLPDGFDTSSLADDAGIKDRYQLGARVVGAVSCAWIEQWVDATEAGNADAAQQATEAMDTSSQWAILQEMNELGEYGKVLQTQVDAMHTGGQVVPPAGPALADSYRDTLGCR
jgi:hypothetical protein